MNNTTVVEYDVNSREARSGPRLLTKYEFCALTNIWTLDRHHRNLLDFNQLFITTLDKFLENVRPEEYPASYQDVFLQKDSGRKFYISHLYCSGDYLEQLGESDPKQNIAYYLRINQEQGFYRCLVRRFGRGWTKEWLVENAGGIEL